MTCVAGLSLGLVIGGCSSASSGAAPGNSGSAAGGSPGPTSSCDSAAYRFDHRAPRPPGGPVLAAIQRPDPDVIPIPDPDENIINEARPADENPDVQETWASDGASAAQSVAQQNQSSNQDLQTVSDEVSADEVESLLGDDLNALEHGTKDYDEDLCTSIGDTIEKFGKALDYYSNLSQVVVYLDGLGAAFNSRAPVDMATAITDAQTRFQQALGTCVDNLDTIHWLLEQIQNIFCNEGE